MDGDPLAESGGLREGRPLYGGVRHAATAPSTTRWTATRSCGFHGIIGDTCPALRPHARRQQQPFERIRRITGYLVGTLDRFNNAKRAEERDRVNRTGLDGLHKLLHLARDTVAIQRRPSWTGRACG